MKKKDRVSVGDAALTGGVGSAWLMQQQVSVRSAQAKLIKSLEMKYVHNDILTNANLALFIGEPTFEHNFFSESLKPVLTIVWNKNEGQQIFIDNNSYNFPPNSFACLVINQSFYFENPKDLIIWQFDKPFYCIEDNDKEVSCIGFLFWGNKDFFTISINEEQAVAFEMIYNFFISEFRTKDNIQSEMLRALLKRMIIKINGLAKSQHLNHEMKEVDLDIVRQFNLLVEKKFRQYHKVQDYAGMLYKSPKTLSNLFKLYNNKSPLEIIHERLVLEGKRLLIYTEKNIKEIAGELGFEEVSHFSRLFKNITNTTPIDFKKNPK